MYPLLFVNKLRLILDKQIPRWADPRTWRTEPVQSINEILFIAQVALSQILVSYQLIQGFLKIEWKVMLSLLVIAG